MRRVAEDTPYKQSKDLPDDAVVVRHGAMKFDMETGANTCFDVYGVYGLSGSAVVGLDADAIAIQSHRNHGKISETTAGALRAAGYPVEFTFNGDHVTIKLPGPPVDDVLTDFRNLFGELRPNPKLNLDP